MKPIGSRHARTLLFFLSSSIGGSSHSARQRPQELAEELGGVDRLPVLVAVDVAEADVEDAVAHREHPAVAGQLVALEHQLQIDVEAVGVRPVGVHLGADRDRRVAVVLRVDLQRALDGGVGAVGGDDRVAVHLLAALEHHADDAAVRVEFGSGHLGGLAHLGARGLGVLEQQGVELGAADGVAVIGHARALRERQLPWLGLNTVTRLTRWNLATSSARPIFCR